MLALGTSVSKRSWFPTAETLAQTCQQTDLKFQNAHILFLSKGKGRRREAHHKFEASPGCKGNPGQLHNETLSKVRGKHQKNLCSSMTVWSARVLVWFL